MPVAVEEFIPHWIALSRPEQTRLVQFNGNNRLGTDALLGEHVLDAQHKIRLRIGPMPLARYEEILPGEKAVKQIAAWIRTMSESNILSTFNCSCAKKKCRRRVSAAAN